MSAIERAPFCPECSSMIRMEPGNVNRKYIKDTSQKIKWWCPECKYLIKEDEEDESKS